MPGSAHSAKALLARGFLISASRTWAPVASVVVTEWSRLEARRVAARRTTSPPPHPARRRSGPRQALQISNAKTSGSFGDQTFAPLLGTPAQQGTSLTHFAATFSIGHARRRRDPSTTSGTQRPRLGGAGPLRHMTSQGSPRNCFVRAIQKRVARILRGLLRRVQPSRVGPFGLKA
jgi:hypothetical protein